MASPVLATKSDDEGDFIFRRNLAQVHLLLDFISGRPPDVQAREFDDRKESGTIAGLPSEVIERITVTEMRHRTQTGESTQDRARDSALLLSVKDKLNVLAYPASAMTIAYSYMFLEGTETATARHLPSESQQTRASVARVAYPGLITSARRFRYIHKCVAWMGAIVALFAVLLFWLIASGMQLTSQFKEDQSNAHKATQEVFAQGDKENAALPAAQQTRDTPSMRCQFDQLERQSSEMRLSCGEWAFAQARYERSIRDAATFANRWPASWLMKPFGGSPGPAEHVGNGGFRANQEDIQSIALVLSAYANYVLPVLFGVVGTIASFLRDVGNRITSGTLAPRDETFAIIRLILGAFVGLAVGIFFIPGSAAAGISRVGLLISASGIVFLAGYAADGFFDALDAIITRVFRRKFTVGAVVSRAVEKSVADAVQTAMFGERPISYRGKVHLEVTRADKERSAKQTAYDVTVRFAPPSRNDVEWTAIDIWEGRHVSPVPFRVRLDSDANDFKSVEFSLAVPVDDEAKATSRIKLPSHGEWRVWATIIQGDRSVQILNVIVSDYRHEVDLGDKA
jgi:hypothetical protein